MCDVLIHKPQIKFTATVEQYKLINMEMDISMHGGSDNNNRLFATGTQRFWGA